MSVKKGQTVNVHYVGTLDDGTEFDNSRNRGEPLKFEVGASTIMPAFQDAVSEMKIGETKKISVSPEEAYGPVNPEAYRKVPIEHFDENIVDNVGKFVHGQNDQGHRFSALVESIEEDGVLLNFNHPMAGKSLNFEIELISTQ